MPKTTRRTVTDEMRAVPALPRDLADFHLRWPEFRALAASIAERDELSNAEREVLGWLLRLADRVGPRDLI